MKKIVSTAAEIETKASAPVAHQSAEEKTDNSRHYEVGRGETVSVIAGNRVLFLGTGITGITIE